jgi:hypothetical protein
VTAGCELRLEENLTRAREEDVASVYGYTGTLRANSEGTREQAMEEDAASVYGYTDA